MSQDNNDNNEDKQNYSILNRIITNKKNSI